MGGGGWLGNKEAKYPKTHYSKPPTVTDCKHTHIETHLSWGSLQESTSVQTAVCTECVYGIADVRSDLHCVETGVCWIL